MKRVVIAGVALAALMALRWALAGLVVERELATLLLTVPDDPMIAAPIALAMLQIALYVVAPCLLATWALDTVWIRLKARRQGHAGDSIT